MFMIIKYSILKKSLLVLWQNKILFFSILLELNTHFHHSTLFIFFSGHVHRIVNTGWACRLI